MVLVGFLINDLSKIESFHQHWKKTLLKRCNLKPCGQKFLSFLLHAYFCEKILNWYQMHFL